LRLRLRELLLPLSELLLALENLRRPISECVVLQPTLVVALQ
jgi:hypothetical protein